jgi:hypothetical protein
MTTVTVEDLESGIMEDYFSVYGGLGSGRLIILGGPGAGKSSSGILLLRDALDHRAALTAEDQARVPVPVLVSPQDWNPITEPFTQWLAVLLGRDYELLRAPEYGADVAMRLIMGGYIAVILDGLDDMLEALRPMALYALGEQTNFRLVVLTRSEALVTAVSDAHLPGAAALELLPIEPAQAAEYLTRCQRDPLSPAWKYLINHLREGSDGALERALNTPLMLTLLRDTYDLEGQFDELVSAESHLKSKDIEDDLCERVLTAAYARRPHKPDPPYSDDQARRWLGQLAHRMKKEDRDLAWWAIPRWVPAWPRAFATVVIISLASASIIGLLTAFATRANFFSAFQLIPETTIVTIFAKTLGYAFMFGTGLLFIFPSTGEPPQRNRLQWNRADILTILILGLGVGVGIGLERGFGFGSALELGSKLRQGCAVGLVSSFVVVLGLVLNPVSPQQPGWLRWAKNDIRTNLFSGLVVGLVAGTGYWMGYGLRFGLVYGLIVGVGYTLVFVVDKKPSRSDLQQGGNDIPVALLIGLVIAIVTTAGYGIIYLLISILSRRSPLRRRQLRWSETATPATLLTGLMTGLVLGLVYGLVYALAYGLAYGRELGLTLGLTLALPLGLGFGLMIGLLLVLRQPPTEATSPLDPQLVWRRERQFGLIFGLMFGLASGLTGGLADWLVAGPGAGLALGVTGGIVFGIGAGLTSSATWATALANAQLQRRNEAPAHMLQFLDDARERHILRKVGSAYQFRDARLQDWLIKTR